MACPSTERLIQACYAKLSRPRTLGTSLAMAHLTLVALTAPNVARVEDRIAPFLESLEAAGHEVETLISGRTLGDGELPEPWQGLASAAVDGLRSSSGEVVLLLDLSRPYTPADTLKVASPLIGRTADVAVGCPGKARLSARLLAPVARTVDPWSGLVGVRSEVFADFKGRLRPVGERFALEIVQRAEGRRVDVDLPDRPGDSPRGWHWDDIRHLKRLADDRLGMVSRLAQFCLVGASGMVVDLSFYAFFQWLFRSTTLASRTLPIIGSSLALALAGLLSVALALLWNFSLNRRLTFNDSKKNSVVAQFITYVLSNALGIMLSLTLRLTLPRWFVFFENHKLAAAVVGIVAITGVSFTMARWFVFPGEKRSDEAAEVGPTVERLDPTPTESAPAHFG